MKTLDRGQDKVKEICQALKKQTLEPAEKEAVEIVEKAKEEAEKIVRAAHLEAKEIIEKGKSSLMEEKKVFSSNLDQAGRQALALLRQDVENTLFNQELGSWLKEGSAQAGSVAKVIEAIVEALQKEGVKADLLAYIPNTLSAEEINQELGHAIVSKLQKESVSVGNFSGGAKVRMDGKKITIDISDQALKEMLSAYVRKDFRKHLFHEK